MVNSPPPTTSYASPIVSFNLISSSSSQQQQSESTHRLGKLLLNCRTNPHELVQTFETPGLISNASRGSLNHLTPDNFKRIHHPDGTGGGGVHLSLEHFLDFQPPRFSLAPFELSRFFSFNNNNNEQEKETRVLISMSLRDPSQEQQQQRGGDRTKSVPTNGDQHAIAIGGRGVVKVTSKDFLNWTLARPPDLLFSISDQPLPGTGTGIVSKKRLDKSFKRSLNWLKELAPLCQNQTNLFATLIGGNDQLNNRRIEFSKSLLIGPLDSLIAGYVLPLPSTTNSSVKDLLNSSLSPLPISKPRIILAPKGPHEILRLIRDVGIDLFAGEEWSQNCSTWGIALDFQFPIPESPPPPEGSEKKPIGINLYESHHSFDFSPLSNSSLSHSAEEEHPFGPLGSPSKSYVHHLLLAHEMTSHVILALHNQFLMLKFFKSIRETLRLGGGGSVVFDREVEKFNQFYQDRTVGEEEEEEYEVVKQGRKGWNLVEKARGKGSLKDKVLELEKQQANVLEEKEKILSGQELELRAFLTRGKGNLEFLKHVIAHRLNPEDPSDPILTVKCISGRIKETSLKRITDTCLPQIEEEYFRNLPNGDQVYLEWRYGPEFSEKAFWQRHKDTCKSLGIPTYDSPGNDRFHSELSQRELSHMQNPPPQDESKLEKPDADNKANSIKGEKVKDSDIA
ncbi:hypothetical protein JCM3765_007016 [Sporobolomyces pararoseus]